VLVLLAGVVGAIAGGPDDDEQRTATRDEGTTTTAAPAEDPEPTATTTVAPDEPATLFPGRPDAQREDREANIGDAVELSGYTVTVTSAGFVQRVSDFEEDGYIKVSVSYLNRDDQAQPYNLFDWRLQTPAGQVIDPTFTTAPTLGSGDLVEGGTVSGDVYFEPGAETGDFYIIWKPDLFDAARGIWKVTV
jgi:hypothetical protein